MKKLFAAALLFAVAGCGGGGYSTPASGSSTPTPAPSSSATSAPASVLQTATLAGSPGFVASNGHTVYVLSADSFNSSACTSASGCTGLWPVISPPSGTTPGNGWTVFMRSDGTLQLAYNGNPLYTYSGDSASGQTNGNGINSFGGVWTIARPNMANAPGVPQPTAPPNQNGGY
jgi:predicted lipoprotein with Yx(FWY)xxD motif